MSEVRAFSQVKFANLKVQMSHVAFIVLRAACEIHLNKQDLTLLSQHGLAIVRAQRTQLWKKKACKTWTRGKYGQHERHVSTAKRCSCCPHLFPCGRVLHAFSFHNESLPTHLAFYPFKQTLCSITKCWCVVPVCGEKLSSTQKQLTVFISLRP